LLYFYWQLGKKLISISGLAPILPISKLSVTSFGAGGKLGEATTLPETNMEPENEALQKEIPIANHHF